MGNNGPVLYVNSRDKNCGVYQFGRNVFSVLERSTTNEYRLAECNNVADLDAAIGSHRPRMVIYNFHPATTPWIDVRATRRYPFPQIGTIHEVTQFVADTADTAVFDYHIAPDPTLLLRSPRVFKTGRFVPNLDEVVVAPSVPTIGSFGFATPNKRFEKLVEQVQLEWDEATIRLNLPAAHFGDREGRLAQEAALRCRAVLRKPGIKLHISHEFLSDKELLRFLGENSLNAFFYEDVGARGISSVIDYALAVDRPIAVSESPMFRHLHGINPGVVFGPRCLREILDTGTEPLANLKSEWSQENLVWDYDRIVAAVEVREAKTRAHGWLRRNSAGRRAAGTAVLLARKSATAIRILANEAGISDEVLVQKANRGIQRVVRKLSSVNTPLVDGDWMPAESDVHAVVRPPSLPPYIAPVRTNYNRLLDDAARSEFQDVVEDMRLAAPAVMSRKIPRANVQQAFVLDAVAHFLEGKPEPRLLCVGSYEDTAALRLIAGGLSVEELDPVLNYDIGTFLTKPTTRLSSYDVVFSTSVIEHVVDDAQFASDMASLVAHGGVVVFTCDFSHNYRDGDPKPRADIRLYTQERLLNHILPAMKGFELVDEPTWSKGTTDFYYDGCSYAFASFVARKHT